MLPEEEKTVVVWSDAEGDEGREGVREAWEALQVSHSFSFLPLSPFSLLPSPSLQLSYLSRPRSSLRRPCIRPRAPTLFRTRTRTRRARDYPSLPSFSDSFGLTRRPCYSRHHTANPLRVQIRPQFRAAEFHKS